MINMIDVAVVKDDPGLFEEMRAYAAQASDLAIREASAETLLSRTQQRPDVVLFEVVRRADADPIADVRTLCKAGHRVLALSRSADPYLSAALLGTGACLLLGRNQTSAAIVAAIRASGTRSSDASPRLSQREKSVLMAYTSGMTLDAVAQRVGIRPSTAKTYLERVKAKYREAGRAAYTKLELAQRAEEDRASSG
jgi:two-component system, NarL family, nitrate/nitrite response regulator NarL